MIDYNNFINKKISTVKPSGIRKFFDIANEMDDVISLSIGEPDFQTPWHIREEGINSLKKGKTWYSPNRGFAELREEIAAYYKRRFGIEYDAKKQTLVTVGGSEGIDMAIRTLIDNGDEVLVVEPSFVCYKPIIEVSGGKAIPIATKLENEFKLTPEDIENNVTPKTKAIVLPFPNNPTGAIMNEKELKAICKVIIKHNLFVISDEIYSELTYTPEGHISIASIAGMKERTIVINGFSKTYSMTGWRLGYALGPAPVIKQMTKLHQFAIMSAPTNSQYAAIDALRNGDNDIKKMVMDYDMRRRFTVDAFRKIGLECFEPKGAFYVFPCIKSTGLSSDEFCERLIKEKHVAVIPGNAFGDSGEGYIRASYCYSIDNIKEAITRIGEFVKELKNES